MRLNVHYDLKAKITILIAVVYATKCVLDDVLDMVEDSTDATINALGPLLQGIFGKPLPPCDGAKLVGLCI